MTSFTVPRAIAKNDDVREFGCGKPPLDDWLHRRAKQNEAKGASRTFVTFDSADPDGTVVGYYCLSTFSLLQDDEVPRALSQGMPDPIPAVLLGRLAVDERCAGQGVGASLLQDSIRRALGAAASVGMRAMIVHALDDEAVAFYQRFGFESFPGQRQTLYLLFADVVATIDGMR